MLLTRARIPAAATARTMATIADVKRLTAKSLSEKMLKEVDAAETTYAIIDVRDDDYIGGHIKGCTNIPSIRLDAMMPTLVRQLQGKSTVVFHCALSQQRGPSAALKYLRERNHAVGDAVVPASEQDVCVLDKGFVGWQEAFGADERLTEGYRNELWENY